MLKEQTPELRKGMGLASMITLQKALLDKYVEIEKFNPPVWDMRLKKNQIAAKGFIFRVVEELAEAYESHQNADYMNFWTELADATHFLLELGIVSGHHMKQDVWEDIWEGVEDEPRLYYDSQEIQQWFWGVTFKLGLVSNAMRNKQWKQTEVLPDMAKFNTLMDDVYDTFFRGFIRIGGSEKRVFTWYWRKNKVNHFRINSKY